MTFEDRLQAAFQAFDSGDLDTAEKQYKALLADVDDGERGKQSSVMHMLGFVYALQGKYDAARDTYQALLADSVDNQSRHVLYHQLAMVERLAGDYTQALAYLDQEAALLADGDSTKWAAHHYEIGHMYMLMDEHATATSHFQQALDYAQEANDPINIACAYRGLGDVAATEGDSKSAHGHYQASITHFAKADDKQGIREVETRLEALADG